MIRTLIEVQAEDGWEHERQLKATLDKLGYEPKRDVEYGQFLAFLRSALHEQGLDPNKLVDDYRAKMSAPIFPKESA